MKLYLATDHAGFELKEALKVWLDVHQKSNVEVIDLGAHTYDESDDYVDHIKHAAIQVHNDPHHSKAVIFGGSGQGEAMAANRYSNVRATVYYGGNPEILRLSREHNDANVLSIGARFVDLDTLTPLLNTWLTSEGANDERHVRRIKKLTNLP